MSVPVKSSKLPSSTSNTTTFENEASSSTSIFTIDKTVNLETFSLLWLDANVHKTDDNIKSQRKLREAINFLQIFDQVDQCEENIRKIEYEKVVFIVSGRLGREIVPRLHDLPQLNSVYVYCLDRIGNKQWADKYSKV